MASKSEEENGSFINHDHWGQVIFTHDSKPPVLISKNLLTLGRKEDCDISFVGCKFVSGHHCSLSRDPDGKVWLQDFSTNGSLLNGKKITKDDEKTQICHNDQVQIVHRKDPGSDIAFVFQDLKFLREEASLLDNTLEYHLDTEEDISEDEEIKRAEKRPHSETVDTDEGPEVKKKHTECAAVSDEKKPEMVPHNSIAETLLCSICQDIFHDCVSLQPCIHSFCAACYSQWMDRSSECPSCRNKVERISKNYIVNNLVEAFLKEHPERQRSEEELREMDAKNKITEDMLRPKRKRSSGLFGLSSFDDEDDEDDDEDDDDDDSDGSDGGEALTSPVIISELSPASFGGFLGFSLSRFRPLPTSCRLCPGYISPSISSASCAASTSKGASISVTPPDYTCAPDQMHVLCQCCLQPMPHNWPDSLAASIPAQKCAICSKHFCHLLWGCRKANCLGCLNKFTDFSVGENNLLSLINNNPYESKILKDYQTEQSLSKEDLLQKCLQKLESKEFSTADAASNNLTSSSVLCYKCGLRNFQELAYQFRRDIPRDQLPDAVHSRADCYWGQNCRTQRTKPLHASRFNHICEQTRFTT